MKKEELIKFQKNAIDVIFDIIKGYIENYVTEEDIEFEYNSTLTETEYQIIDDYNNSELPQEVDDYFQEKMGELNITSIYCDEYRMKIIHVELCKCK